jgi:hypothetical protein
MPAGVPLMLFDALLAAIAIVALVYDEVCILD